MAKRGAPKPVLKAMPASKAKAAEMLRHGEVNGKPLTEKQKGLFGLIASGKKPTRMKERQ